jgi:hypothetical protein
MVFEVVTVAALVAGTDELEVLVTGDAPQPAASIAAVSKPRFVVSFIFIQFVRMSHLTFNGQPASRFVR